ncbi:MAG TPA: hypothetical protein VMB50_09080 [Myxococcales bacterium]|nr:hypothetical protein [Myxococcales bacterium]
MLRALALAAAILGISAPAFAASTRSDETGQALREETEPHQVVTGRIAGVDGWHRLVLVDRAKGGTMVLRLTPETVVTADGRPASVEDIKEGVPIRAAYKAAYGHNRALVVDVSRLGAFPPAHVTPEPAP